MQIKILTSLAGVGFSWNPGETIEVDDAEAVRLIEAGYAEPYSPPLEKAVASKREKAVAAEGK